VPRCVAAGIDGALGRERQRIGRVRLEHAGRDRQVDDADVVGVLDRDRVVDRLDDVADITVPVSVEDLERNEVGARRDASARAVRIEAIAGDDARDMRAMTELVRRQLREPDTRGQIAGEVPEVDDARRKLRIERVGVIQVVVLGGDAGVDDCHANTLSGEAELPPRQRGADRGAGAFERGKRIAIGDHARDARFLGKRFEREVVDVGDLRPHARELLSRDAALPCDDGRIRRVAKFHDHA
jgi:hypothetical protein